VSLLSLVSMSTFQFLNVIYEDCPFMLVEIEKFGGMCTPSTRATCNLIPAGEFVWAAASVRDLGAERIFVRIDVSVWKDFSEFTRRSIGMGMVTHYWR